MKKHGPLTDQISSNWDVSLVEVVELLLSSEHVLQWDASVFFEAWCGLINRWGYNRIELATDGDANNASCLVPGIY